MQLVELLQWSSRLGSPVVPAERFQRESSWSWLCHVCGMKLKKSGNTWKKITRFINSLYAACLVPAVKLKTGISRSSCRKVSEREFLEFMLRPETAGRTTLTGVLQLLKRSRSTGVCEVSVLETGCIVGSTDKRPEVPQGCQNRRNTKFYKRFVVSLTQASSPASLTHQLWPDPPVQEDIEKQR